MEKKEVSSKRPVGPNTIEKWRRKGTLKRDKLKKTHDSGKTIEGEILEKGARARKKFVPEGHHGGERKGGTRAGGKCLSKSRGGKGQSIVKDRKNLGREKGKGGRIWG